jgi:hypothetical protein
MGIMRKMRHTPVGDASRIGPELSELPRTPLLLGASVNKGKKKAGSKRIATGKLWVE